MQNQYYQNFADKSAQIQSLIDKCPLDKWSPDSSQMKDFLNIIQLPQLHPILIKFQINANKLIYDYTLKDLQQIIENPMSLEILIQWRRNMYEFLSQKDNKQFKEVVQNLLKQNQKDSQQSFMKDCQIEVSIENYDIQFLVDAIQDTKNQEDEVQNLMIQDFFEADNSNQVGIQFLNCHQGLYVSNQFQNNTKFGYSKDIVQFFNTYIQIKQPYVKNKLTLDSQLFQDQGLLICFGDQYFNIIVNEVKTPVSPFKKQKTVVITQLRYDLQIVIEQIYVDIVENKEKLYIPFIYNEEAQGLLINDFNLTGDDNYSNNISSLDKNDGSLVFKLDLNGDNQYQILVSDPDFQDELVFYQSMKQHQFYKITPDDQNDAIEVLFGNGSIMEFKNKKIQKNQDNLKEKSGSIQKMQVEKPVISESEQNAVKRRKTQAKIRISFKLSQQKNSQQFFDDNEEEQHHKNPDNDRKPRITVVGPQIKEKKKNSNNFQRKSLFVDLNQRFQSKSFNISEQNDEEDENQHYLSSQSTNSTDFVIINPRSSEAYNVTKIDQFISKYGVVDENNFSKIIKEYENDWNQKKQQLLEAVKKGNHYDILLLLDHHSFKLYPIDLNEKINNKSYLHMAAELGHLEVILILSVHGADLENKTTIEKQTPLHIATISGHFKIVDLLLKEKANINAQDYQKNTPLHYAVEKSNNQIIELLLQKNAETNIQNEQGSDPEDLVQSEDIIKIFQKYNKSKFPNIEASVDLMNIQNDKGKITPDSFDFIKVLGRGGFGQVFLGSLKQPLQKGQEKEYYAIKTVDKTGIIQNNLSRYANTERDVLSMMKHPFIVELKFAFQNKNLLFMALEYCPGGDLCQLLDKKQRLTEDEARVYISEIVLALEALHQNNIIYRDLKPANIVIDQQGHAKLTDFGLSKQVSDDDFSQTMCGTPYYMAPEMITHQAHGKQVDWYLLGVLLYECLVGVVPYSTQNQAQAFQNILHGNLVIPSQLSNPAKDLIIKLMNRDQYSRLGAKNDALDVKKHPWFKSIKWTDVLDRKLKPPFVPSMNIDTQTNMDLKFDSKLVDDDDEFDGWSYQPDNLMKLK